MRITNVLIEGLGAGAAGVVRDVYLRQYMSLNHPRISKKVAEAFGCSKDAAFDVIMLDAEMYDTYKKHVNKAQKLLVDGDMYAEGLIAEVAIKLGFLHKFTPELQAYLQEKVAVLEGITAEDTE